MAIESDLGTRSHALTDGTPTAAGILNLLNASSTTFEVLDIDVPLDRRAARNLITYRNKHGLFRTLAEVDGVRWVGPVAISLLGSFADQHGWVPAGGDLLGTWDGVAFTVDEATWTLAFVNTASEQELDFDAALDSRAVTSILAARPLDSILTLSELYYVGQSALLKLREYPKTLAGTTPEGSDCTAHEECSSGVCAGLTIGMGICVADWMVGTYVSTEVRPIGDPGSVITEIVVDDQASVPMDVIVTLDIDHPRPADLIVELFQPGGGYELLWDHEANPAYELNPYGIERDNMINGTWRLEVTDTVTGEAGVLNGWSMWLTSRWD